MDIHKNARLTPKSRALLVDRVLGDGWTVAEASRVVGVSERTGWKWLARFREAGLEGLDDRSSRPRRSRRTSVGTRRRIVKLRHARLTCRKIASHVRRSRATVARIVKAAGLARLRSLDAPPPPIVRYEYERAGGLLHLDTKKLSRIDGLGHRITGNRRGQKRGRGYDFVHVCIDDHSRVAYVEILADECGETAAAFFRRAVTWYHNVEFSSSGCSPTTGPATAPTFSLPPVVTLPSATFVQSPTLPERMARQSGSFRRCCVNGPTVIPFAAQPSVNTFSIRTCTSTITIACTPHSLTSRRSLG